VLRAELQADQFTVARVDSIVSIPAIPKTLLRPHSTALLFH